MRYGPFIVDQWPAFKLRSHCGPEARHARKSTSQKRDGFKAHVVVEPDTGITTATRMTKAAGA
ncbi:MAG: hypothetical protein FWG25_02235 [Promicromonosporaceae bacterium]|nr:hypothetical protein [Promicromonosporaceae bacterium]